MRAAAGGKATADEGDCVGVAGVRSVAAALSPLQRSRHSTSGGLRRGIARVSVQVRVLPVVAGRAGAERAAGGVPGGDAVAAGSGAAAVQVRGQDIQSES